MCAMSALFLRFIWGRSKLPLNDAAFGDGMKVSLAAGSSSTANGRLPVAHTCFFHLELPGYTNLEACREKILYAIQNCRMIDGDDEYSEGRQNRDAGLQL